MQRTLNDLADCMDKELFWKKNAIMYDTMAKLERKYTIDIVEKMELKTIDRVLDIGCGVGRITKEISPNVREVVGMDISTYMLNYAEKNTKKCNNVKFIKGDFLNSNFLNNLGKFDVIICSRIPFLSILDNINNIAKRKVYITGFSNAPNLLSIKEELFSNNYVFNIDRLDGYNIFFNEVYKKGYDVNVILLEDGLYATYNKKEELLRDISKIDLDNKINEKSLEKYTYLKDNKYILDIKTKSFLMWWDIEN